MTESILSTRDLSFQFPDSARPVLAHADFSLKAGQSLALLGPTGSGKSVLLKLLAGLLNPVQGQVLFHGKDLRQFSAKQWKAFRHQLGMTFQKDGLFDSLSCGENLSLPLWEVERVSGKAADKRVEAALESVELKGQGHLRITEMSGGMQKRLGIARALLFQPSIVLYDEPTAGLDPITSQTILKLIAQRQSESKAAMVLVSSQPKQIRQITSEAVFVWDSKVGPSEKWSQLDKTESAAIHQFLSGGLKGPLTEAYHD